MTNTATATAALLADIQASLDVFAARIDESRAALSRAEAIGSDVFVAHFTDMIARLEARAESLLDQIVDVKILQIKCS